MKFINYENIYNRCYGLNISSIYFEIESDLFELDIDNYEEAKLEFINALRFLICEKKCILKFRYDDRLNNSTLDEQLLYINDSFPNEVDETVPEKDIENLWWYFSCPVDIGWRQADNSYFISG